MPRSLIFSDLDGKRVTRARALAGWSGFVSLAPAELSRRPFVVLTGTSSTDANRFLREHSEVGEAQELGCHFLRDVVVAGHMYAFVDDQLLDDGSHLAMVSAKWLARVPGHGPRHEGRTPWLIEEPVLPVAGPGHRTYGHWIIDFLPRLAIAKEVLGDEFAQLKFLILTDTPDWALSLMQTFMGIRESACIRVTPGVDELRCAKLCYPTFAHSYPFLLHGFVERFYRRFYLSLDPNRRLCIKRRTPADDHRLFARRGRFEDLAARRGFALIDPQGLTMWEQAVLFGSARVVVGEYGSAMHNSVFSAQDSVFGVLNAPGVEQTRLCAAFSQRIVYATDTHTGRGWSLDDRQLDDLFDTVSAMADAPRAT